MRNTKQILVDALMEANAPKEMIDLAKHGYYHDYETPIATPISQLIIDARASGLEGIAERAIKGDFDATEEEGVEWFKNNWQLLLDKGES